MAKAKTKSKKKNDAPSIISSDRKKEVFGLIIMAMAFLLSLAIITYTPLDDGLAQAFTLQSAIDPGNNQASNALGLLGATLSLFLVRHFLGYTTLLYCGILFSWGYVIFRHRKPVFLPLITTLMFVGSFVLATFFGWIGAVSGADMGLWAGTVGTGVAGWMQRIFGTPGSFILLILALVVTVMLLVDRDIQKSLDRIEDFFGSLRSNMSTWWINQTAGFQARKSERKKLKAEALRKREVERAQREKEKVKRQTEARKQHQKKEPTRSKAPTPSAQSASPPSPPRRPTPTHEPSSSSPPPKLQTLPLATVPLEPVEEGPAFSVQERIEEEKTDTLVQTTAEVPKDVPFVFPPIDLLDAAEDGEFEIDEDELEENKQILLDKLETYNIEITAINAIVGPTVTLYELTPAPGVKISKIKSLEDDLAMAMAARGIRMIAPIPGKSAIGVEIPNRHREFVRIRDIIGTKKFQDADMALPVPLGKTIEGEVFLVDLTKMPHLLIAGATGSGKSVGVNGIINGLIYACHPANLKFVMIDPKKIELQQYARLLDHYIAMPEEAEQAIITDFTQALGVLKCCEKEMERRYDLLSDATVRSIKDYNKKVHAGKLDPRKGHTHLPYIVVIVDELADLMMTAGKDIEAPIARLAQMARAVGIHLILATQRPSVDVITGLIKANFPARVAFQVASKIDSRTIMDQNGAEGLVGNGDMLYMLGSKMVRLQSPFVSDDEVDRITEFIEDQPGLGPFILPSLEEDELPNLSPESSKAVDRDDLFEEAARIIVRAQQGSVSLLQRKLSVGYSRAARLVDQLEDAGIVGPFEGSKARQVYMANEFELDEHLNSFSS